MNRLFKALCILFGCIALLLLLSIYIFITYIRHDAGRSAMPRRATVFMELCAHGSPGEIEWAIQNGADIHALYEGRSALQRAALFNKNPDAVTVLLDHGADVNAESMWERTVLSEAIRRDCNQEAVFRLLKAGADVHKKDGYGNGLLFNAIREGMEPRIVVEMLRRGAEVNAVGKSGVTPLIEAVSGGSEPEIVSALLAAGADANVRDREGKKALDYARQNPALKEGENAEVYRQLVSATGEGDIPVELLDVESFFALCSTGTAQEVEAIIRRGVDVNALGRRRRTALAYAVHNRKNPGVTHALIRHGADVNAQDGFMISILQEACTIEGNPSAAALLLAFGADPDARDYTGSTALMEAARRGKAEIVELLLDAGADAGIRDLEGKRAVDYAEESGLLEGTEALKRLAEAGKVENTVVQ